MSSSSSSLPEPKQLGRHHFWITIVSSVMALGLLVISSLVLHDAVVQTNGRTELQYALYPKYGVNFYDQIFHDDILIVLMPIVILTAIFQFFAAIFLYRRKQKLQLLLMNVVAWVPVTVAFVICLVYKVDTVGLKTPDFNGYDINTYFAYKYDKGQALCAILGCDMFLLFFTAIALLFGK